MVKCCNNCKFLCTIVDMFGYKSYECKILNIKLRKIVTFDVEKDYCSKFERKSNK